MKSKLFILDKPNFYKTNLLNKLIHHTNVNVVYTGTAKIKREGFFNSGKREFKYLELSGCKLMKALKLLVILLRNRKSEVIVNGYNELLMALTLVTTRCSMILESTKYERTRSGYKRRLVHLIKVLLLRRVRRFYCVGSLHCELAKTLNNRAELVVTHTVGLPFEHEIEKSTTTIEPQDFIYIGRNSREKNVKFVVESFCASLISSGSILYLAGDNFDEFETYSNIMNIGVIDRPNLPEVLARYRALILLSTEEPYGLVVEEALRCGVPVIISKYCGINGCFDIHMRYGIVLQNLTEQDFDQAIRDFLSHEVSLREKVSKIDFSNRDLYSLHQYAS